MFVRKQYNHKRTEESPVNFRTTLIASSLIAVSLVSGAAHAALQGRDLDGNLSTFEAYYDTDLDITWLADANQGAGSSYDDWYYSMTDGRMTWANAMAWATNLSFTDGVNVYDNWRLPTTLQPDASCGTLSNTGHMGYNCTGSEMGHLFYSVLGGTAGEAILTSADQFTNLQANSYWSATEYAFGTYWAWTFYMYGGYQYPADKTSGSYALAVSPGDVGAVPEAQTYALMLAGLGLIGWRARRRG